MNRRMDRSRLQIGTYYLKEYAHTEEHVRDLRDCGIDFVIGMSAQGKGREVLDYFFKYGVGAIVSDAVPGWSGGVGKNAGTLCQCNPLEVYERAAAAFEDHPAIWGIDIGDEPSALDFPYYGRVLEFVSRHFPNQFPYLNLYPNYASVSQNNATQTVSQLGTSNYAEHIDAYCREIPADYLSYDFYVYSCNVPKAFDNLHTVAEACRRSGRSMWIVLQVNSNRQTEWITENELRYQAYTAMAYGVEVITWACYTAGWWYNQVLDTNGEKTVQYEKLKTVNRELHTLGEKYMQYRSVATHLVGFDGTPWLDGTELKQEAETNTGVFRHVKATDGAPLAVGEMVGRQDRAAHALFLAAAGDPYDTAPHTRTVTFAVDGGVTVEAFGGNGRLPVVRTAGGLCAVALPPCGGVLVTAV